MVVESAEPEEGPTEVVKALMERAARGVTVGRNQSEREKEWVGTLVEKYGEDYGKMARDRKLNMWQQSEGDIRRRVVKWKKEMAKKGGVV